MRVVVGVCSLLLPVPASARRSELKNLASSGDIQAHGKPSEPCEVEGSCTLLGSLAQEVGEDEARTNHNHRRVVAFSAGSAGSAQAHWPGRARFL